MDLLLNQNKSVFVHQLQNETTYCSVLFFLRKKIHRFPTCERPSLQGLNTPDFPEGLKRKTKQRDVHCEQTHFLLPKWLRYKQMEIVPGITKWIGLIVLVTSLPSVLLLLLPGETSHTCVKRVLVSIPSGRQKDISVLTLLSRFSGFFL